MIDNGSTGHHCTFSLAVSVLAVASRLGGLSGILIDSRSIASAFSLPLTYLQVPASGCQSPATVYPAGRVGRRGFRPLVVSAHWACASPVRAVDTLDFQWSCQTPLQLMSTLSMAFLFGLIAAMIFRPDRYEIPPSHSNVISSPRASVPFAPSLPAGCATVVEQHRKCLFACPVLVGTLVSAVWGST